MKIQDPYAYDPTISDSKVYRRHPKCQVCARYESCLDVTAELDHLKFPCEQSGDFSDFTPKADMGHQTKGDHSLDHRLFIHATS